MAQVIEGTWEEIAQHAREFNGKQRFRLIPLPSTDKQIQADQHGRMIRKGIFPQLRDLTEEDFKSAEWHGEDIEF
ncbi:MAG TPA: hypothetical protein VFA07_13860 [Chthonomonadaceae bacterium]|nr:hypothetical protein [Chthonomonadaceae bacterium]